MSFEAWTLNTAWMLNCRGEHRAFLASTRNVAEAQAAVLHATLKANQNSAFGRLHAFDSLHTSRDYSARAPIVEYADLAPWIDRIAAGEANVLTEEPVERLVPTSGTTSAEKWIPYTAGLRRQFQRGINTWVGDLYSKRPAVRSGRAYWSISPALGPERKTTGGLPVGFPDDTAYLGRFERFAMRRLLAAPSVLSQLTDLASVRYATLLHLLAADDLSFISVWSPSFLTLLLAPLFEWGDRLCNDLKRGTFSLPVSPGAAQAPPAPRADPRRAEQVVALIKAPCSHAERLAALWPKLAVISCWTDGSARHLIPPLRRLFPSLEIQPKGLLATEGFISAPVCDHEGAVLAIRSHYFEFLDPGGVVRLAHELELEGRYRVIITTAGGLYRYQMHDEVQVTGFLNQCPLIRFLGKADRVSDLVGEKLSEQQVESALSMVCDRNGLQPAFALLVPVLEPTPRYRLYAQGVASARLPRVANDLEEALSTNPYYRHAVGIGQLAPLEVRLLSDDVDGPAIVEQEFVRRGQVAGGIKPAVLDRWTGWPELFEQAATSAER